MPEHRSVGTGSAMLSIGSPKSHWMPWNETVTRKTKKMWRPEPRSGPISVMSKVWLAGMFMPWTVKQVSAFTRPACEGVELTWPDRTCLWMLPIRTSMSPSIWVWFRPVEVTGRPWKTQQTVVPGASVVDGMLKGTPGMHRDWTRPLRTQLPLASNFPSNQNGSNGSLKAMMEVAATALAGSMNHCPLDPGPPSCSVSGDVGFGLGPAVMLSANHSTWPQTSPGFPFGGELCAGTVPVC